MVVPNEIGGVKLRIRDADTDIELARINAKEITITTNNCKAVFDVTNIKGIIIGKYYKIQLAYISVLDQNDIGYYSTVSIIKCTSYPSVKISGLSQGGINTDISYYSGIYINTLDPSEKCYQYKFTLFDEYNEIITTTDWKIHNVNIDDKQSESKDDYILEYQCDADKRYRIQYSIITSNGLIVSSPKYILVGNLSVAPQLNAELLAELDYDNGCIELSLLPTGTGDNEAYSGFFIISRSDAAEDYKIQTQIFSFSLNGDLPRGPIFRDYTVEHGHIYRYTLQQKNTYDIYSSRVYAINTTPNTESFYQYKHEHSYIADDYALNYYLSLKQSKRLEGDVCDIHAAFEDTYLYDGERQLKIRFNPKVSSFKSVVQDNKKTTLGSQFPFFFRSGNIEYKEFPISGLISYLIDENEFFMTKEEINMGEFFEKTTNLTDENIYYERQFKLKILEWLNNGEVKLFRSPVEGNYLVRLMNVSLSPNDVVGRMLHTFNCTASEADTMTTKNLIKYNIFNHLSNDDYLELRFYTIRFSDYIDEKISHYTAGTPTQEIIDNVINQVKSEDLLQGKECQYLRFEDCNPNSISFTIDNSNDKIIVGATGQYELIAPKEAPIKNLQLIDINYGDTGQITYGIWTTRLTLFDAIINLDQKDIIDFPESTDVNYIDTIANSKTRIKEILFMDFTLKDPVFEIESLPLWAEKHYLRLNSVPPSNNQIQNRRYSVTLTPPTGNNQNISKTYSIKAETIQDKVLYQHELLPDESLVFDKAEQKLYKYNSTIGASNLSNNVLLGELVEIKCDEEDINNSAIPYLKFKDNGEFVYLSPTQIYIDGQIIDILKSGSYHLDSQASIPKKLYWGSRVITTFAYQSLRIDYALETSEESKIRKDGNKSLAMLFDEYNETEKEYAIYKLKVLPVEDGLADVRDITKDNIYVAWDSNNMTFEKLLNEDRINFSGDAYRYCTLAEAEMNYPIWNEMSNLYPYKTKKQAAIDAKKAYFKLLDELLEQSGIEAVLLQ